MHLSLRCRIDEAVVILAAAALPGIKVSSNACIRSSASLRQPGRRHRRQRIDCAMARRSNGNDPYATGETCRCLPARFASATRIKPGTASISPGPEPAATKSSNRIHAQTRFQRSPAHPFDDRKMTDASSARCIPQPEPNSSDDRPAVGIERRRWTDWVDLASRPLRRSAAPKSRHRTWTGGSEPNGGRPGLAHISASSRRTIGRLPARVRRAR